ncbi:hypothetical protein QBC37DRAFT_369983 [Rhypophila decipiens]|uniref:Uncharacterized protein n=1 Tax=Rhypophila decipiens TaxID=261697 RepID=A0AAN6YFB4_9PEZI|nr:hypothetical protein QBC37DRAFT_369983 [Rhypophila decipiens]
MVWNLNLCSVNWANPFAAPVNRKRRQADDGDSPAPKRPKKISPALRRLLANAEEEEELKVEALKRWQPDITPDDHDFLSKLAEFERKMEDAEETVDNILNRNFPADQRELLVPVAADRNPQLAMIQEHNSKQYQDMLKSSAFKDWRSRADIPFKLTLAYFGVPTEPLGLIGPFDRTLDDDWSDGEEDIPVAQPHVRNLRFANQYLHRMYAFDSMRNADPLLETYHAFDNYLAPPKEAQVPRSSDAFSALGLRGGGDDDEDDTYIHQHYHTTLGGEEELAASHGWITLYGYQGQVAFRLNSLNTFVDAVDRLLCLDNRAGVAYKLLMHDRTKTPSRNSWNTLTTYCRGVGNFDTDRQALQWVNSQLPNYDGEKGKPGTKAIVFVMGYGEPVPSRWEPNLGEDRVLRFKLQWRDVEDLRRPDLAYLRVPQNVSAVEYTNQYGPWMANICRVLAPGRIPGRPGRPAIPDAFIGVKNVPSHSQHIGSYGGLAFLPQLWHKIVRSWEKDPLKTVTLQALTTNEGLSDRFFLFLPGDSAGYSYKNFIRHINASDPEVVGNLILQFVKDSMSAESYSQLTGVSVTIPGESALAPRGEVQNKFLPVDIFLPVPTEGGDPAKEAAGPIVSRLRFLVALVNKRKTVKPARNGLQMYPLFISVRPLFRDYKIRAASDPENYVSQDPAGYSLPQFRRLVKNELGIPLVEASPYIEIRQRPKPAEPDVEKCRVPNKPIFIITPSTTEHEWHVIRNWIIEPNIYVSVKDASVQPILGTNTEQPFGYFDIYSLPPRDLYRSLTAESYPKKQRYYDYQMYNQNASERLPTREPAGDARTNVRDPTNVKPPTPRPVTDTKVRPGTQIRASSKKAGYGLDFMHDPAYSDLQKALQMREYSYFHPLDVRLENKIPINAPPLEHIVKKGSSTPKMAVGVLTPSETRKLQRDYYRMRNVLLDRVQKCPHVRCDYTFAVTQEAELQRHFSEVHATKEKCPFCESLDFPFWTKSQQAAHIRGAHLDLVPRNVVPDSPTSPTIPNPPAPQPQGVPKPKGPRTTTVFDSFGEEPEPMGGDTLSPDEAEPMKLSFKGKRSPAFRPKQTKAVTRNKSLAKGPRPAKPSPLDGEDNWQYCARCGRNHAILNSDLDRTQHDQICYFGALDEYHEDDPEDDWEVCTECGVHIPVAAGGQHSPHKPGLHPNKQYCYKCGLGLGQFVEEYRNLHVGICKGYDFTSDRQGDFQFCPWCKKSFDDGGVEVAVGWYKHVQKCSRRPKSEALAGATVSMGGALALAFGDDDEDEEESELSELSELEVEEVPDEDDEVEAGEGTEEPGDDVYVQAAAASPVRTGSGVTTRARAGTRTTPTLKAKEAGILVSPKKPASRKRKTSVEESRNVTFNQVVDIREIPPRPTRAAAGRPKRRRT